MKIMLMATNTGKIMKQVNDFSDFSLFTIHGVSKEKKEKVINRNPKLKVLNAKSDSEKLFSWIPLLVHEFNNSRKR